jgi:thiamine biosynthesis lipoprotein
MANRVLIPLDMTAPPELPSSMQEHRLSGATMGTTWSVHAIASDAICPADLQQGIQAQLDLVIGQMSNWEPDSHVSRFNNAPADSWHALPEAFFTVLDTALSIASDSSGAYDPSIGPVVNLWGFGPEQDKNAAFALQNGDALQSALERCGWQKIELDRQARRARQPGNAHLDFSGIAKGYAVDLVANYLTRVGCVSYLVEIGGELSGSGVKPDGQPWWVALERPPTDTSNSPIVIALHGLAVATSGDYRRYADIDGRRYAHTIDPRTGRPVVNGLASVTVLHRQCMVADALATAFTVMGETEAMRFAQQRHIAALFIRFKEGAFIESMSPTFANMLT